MKMGGSWSKSYDPYQEMKEFYRLDDPTEDEQFRFVEAMEYLISTAVFADDIEAFSYNLAMYYREIRNFQLEQKYLEIGAKEGSPFSMEQLGFLWYYGLCGTQDYEKAFHLFEESETRPSWIMIADMYRRGEYVEQSAFRCREILEDLFLDVESERKDPRFIISTLFPEISLRLVRLNFEEGQDKMFDFDCLLDSRDILSERQRMRPFWGNLKTMRAILELIARMSGNDFDFIDLYDLMTFDSNNAVVKFDYENVRYQIDIFSKGAETVYQFQDKWFHGADDFLEKVRIDGKRITSVYGLVTNIEVLK